MTCPPLGGKVTNDSIIGAVWIEAVSDLNPEDVTSTFIKYMHSNSYGDRKNFLFYMYKCKGQNKNWTLYTALEEVIRHEGPDEVNLRFISANSFHAQVEMRMKEKKVVYDKVDLVSVSTKLKLLFRWTCKKLSWVQQNVLVFIIK